MASLLTGTTIAGNIALHAGNYTSYSPSLTGSGASGNWSINSANVTISNLNTQQVSISLAAGAWYTIAANDSNRASAKFTVTDTSSGLHQAVHFYATAHYGTDTGAKITVVSNTYYSGPPVSAIRIMRGSTYEGAMVQIYAAYACNLVVSIYDNQQSAGWVIKSGVVSTTNPGTVSNFAGLTTNAAQVDLNSGKSFSVSDDIYVGVGTTQYRVLHTNSTLTAGNLSGTIPSAVLGNSAHFIGTTSIALNRASASQTLTGVSIDGTAATATNVAWTGITGGARTNYDLQFQPSAGGYSGFAFKTSSAGEAGYFLIRATSDTDVYTAEGITLVADAGWLTLAQRTTASRGVRIMTGTSSAERLKITTAGDFQIVNGNSFTYNSNTVLHAGNVSTYAFAKSGSWAADLVSSYGYTRETGMQMTGGSEFVVLSKSGQGYLLVDGSYLTGEAGGFYSSNNSSGGTLLGFYSDTTTSLNFNTTSVKLNGNQILHAGNYTSYAVGLGSNNTLTGTNVQNSPNNTFINTVTNANQSLTIYQGTAGADAYLTFHIGGDFAAYFGLGGAENDLVYGGWSVGNFRYRILHSSNQPYAWNLNQNLRTTDSPTFSELSLSGVGTSAYNILKYGGTRTGDWQSFTNIAGQINVVQVENIGAGSHTNYPTGVYTYGGVMSWRLANHSFQLYAAHTGDLAYKTQWGNDNYSGWRRILDSTNYPYAANMNQYVRTTDTCSFAGLTVSNTINGSVSGNAATATTLQTARAINGVSFNGSAAITVNGLNYNVNNEWLRENGDDAHFQMYGNSRTMIYRTDGNTNTHGGGAYAHIFYYGGSADANRMFIINTDGRLWSNYHGWLDTMSTTGNAATATSAGCVNSDTGNVGGSRLQYWQTSGNTALNPDGEWYNAIRMGHGDPVTYYSNTLAVRMTGGNLGDIYTRTTTNGVTGSWNRFWHNNNDGAGSGLDADLVDGLDVHTGRNDNANKIVRTDSNGYIQAGWINTTSGDNGTTAIDRVYASSDAYVRYYTPANFRTVLDVPTRGGSGASGNWAINVTGNAATSTLATKASTLSQGGGNGTGMTFNWSGQSGQPTWLWGSNDGTNIYVWNPSNFNVNSATTATTANALNTSNSYTITGLTSNGTISIFPSYVSPYSSFLRMGYDNSGNYEYTIKRDGTTGFLEFYNTQANYTGYYFRINGSGGGLGIAVSPASRLHVNGDGTNPAVRVDNTGVVLAASVGSNGRTFYGWLPISVDGTTRWIRIFS